MAERLERTRGARRGIYSPRPVTVETGVSGLPRRVGEAGVELIREQWLVEDRWWTPQPLSRRYFELVLADGRDVVVMREPAAGGRWFEQRA